MNKLLSRLKDKPNININDEKVQEELANKVAKIIDKNSKGIIKFGPKRMKRY